MKLKNSAPVNSTPVQATFGFAGLNNPPLSNAALPSDSRAQTLLPFEAVAKTIYVRANGLPAYRRVTGHTRRSADTADCEPISIPRK